MDNTTLKKGFLGQKMISLPKSTINLVKSNLITNRFYITDLGYYPKAKYNYRRRKKGSNEFIFIYCTKGSGEIILNDLKIIIKPNQFFIIPKKVRHEYIADESDPWSIYWFHFNGEIAEDLYNRYSSNANKDSKDVAFSIEKINLFEKIFKLFDDNHQKSQMEYANLLSLNFLSLFIYHNLDSNLNYNDDVVNSIKIFLLNNLNKSYTLDEIATKFNYSKSYLHTKFKSNTGYPIMVFFNLKKTQKACEYLNYTDLSIKEISFKVGFLDPLYFSRIFKSFMGKSPRNYRKSQLK